MKKIDLRLGDNRVILPTFPDNSIDSIVCDPPYEIAFMGSKWDASGIAYDVSMWAECLRVLKPGGHLLAFGGARTYHRLACAIEDAGFIIRDQIMWVFGSGFPKSHNVSKGIDKAAGAEREVIGTHRKGASNKPNGNSFDDDNFEWQKEVNITAPATDEAKQWEGFGSALKPAHEPICMARKPFTGTIAANVLEWGTGAINVDGCRIGTDLVEAGQQGRTECKSNSHGKRLMETDTQNMKLGRFPANFIHDGSDEVLAGFPITTSGAKKPGGVRPQGKTFAFNQSKERTGEFATNTGSAARFFYCAKASKADRSEGLGRFELKQAKRTHSGGDYTTGHTITENANIHPTVKPTDLMQYLCRLVTPVGGTVLDPFMGSGSTGKAAIKEGFCFVGIEQSSEYFDIAEARINYVDPEYLPEIDEQYLGRPGKVVSQMKLF